MPQRLTVEMLRPGTDEWADIGPIALGDPDGTISDNNEGGRDLYLFGVDPVENQGYIKKSTFGVDITEGEVRGVDSAGFVTIAALNNGESHELTVRTDTTPDPRTLRFTYYEE